MPVFEPDEYIQQVLDLYPEGLASLKPEHRYEFDLRQLPPEWPRAALSRDFLEIAARYN